MKVIILKHHYQRHKPATSRNISIKQDLSLNMATGREDRHHGGRTIWTDKMCIDLIERLRNKNEDKTKTQMTQSFNQYSENETKIWRQNILNQFNRVSSSCLRFHFVISLISCREQASTIYSTDKCPRKENGKKVGIMELTKRFSDSMGYSQLSKTSHNLADKYRHLQKTANIPSLLI